MVLGATRVVEFAALHHVAMLVGGISITTVGGLILWIKRFGID